jgi:hypothetical protein
MPNVPQVPGVPPLASFSKTVPALLLQDAISFFGSFFAPRWGIFQDDFPVVVADNVVAFDYRQDFAVADYPLEAGAFESYNKVRAPFNLRFRFSAGGSLFGRQALLASIQAIDGSLDLFDGVTPEAVFPNINITHVDYHRTAERGTGLLVVDIFCLQMRVATAPAFTSTKAASGANAIEGGNVQPQPPTAPQAAAPAAGEIN